MHKTKLSSIQISLSIIITKCKKIFRNNFTDEWFLISNDRATKVLCPKYKFVKNWPTYSKVMAKIIIYSILTNSVTRDYFGHNFLIG